MLRIFALFLFIVTANLSQTVIVNGRVTDKNGNPFSNTQIKTGLNNRDSAIIETDKNGFFVTELQTDEPRNLIVKAENKYAIMIPLLIGNEDSISIKIILDSADHSSYQFTHPNSRLARYAQLHPYLLNSYDGFVTSLQNKEENGEDTKTFFSEWMDSAANLKTLSLQEKDPEIRGEYLLRYYRLTSIHGMVFDTSFYKRMVISIPYNSPLWFFNNYETFDQNIIHPRGKSFVDSVKEYHPSRELRAFLLFQTANESQYQMDENEVRRNYVRLKEDFGDIWWTKIADRFIFAKMNVKRGKQIPDFVFKDINDSTITYSKSSLKGKIYLLDFWATWCLPCVGEIPYMQKAYDKYQSKGFQIISISTDLLKATVSKFREQKYSMPWKHVWISESELKSVTDKFEVSGIPKPILVDSEGNIVGTKAEVRSEELEKTLSTIFKQ